MVSLFGGFLSYSRKTILSVGRDSRLPKPIGKEASGKRLVLGFDGGCSACGELARRIGETTSKLEVCSLHEPRVEEWRKKALGQDPPLVPTLFEVGGPDEVRAWTGWRLGAALGRLLGPFDTWRVMQALGEAGEDPEDEEAPIEGGAVIGLTRGQFLRGVGGRR